MLMDRSSGPSDRYVFELLAIRMRAYGQEGLDRLAVRALSKSPLWLETRILLRTHGFTDAEIAILTGIHPSGCACWTCVRALHRAVYEHSERRKQRDRDRRYRAKKNQG